MAFAVLLSMLLAVGPSLLFREKVTYSMASAKINSCVELDELVICLVDRVDVYII